MWLFCLFLPLTLTLSHSDGPVIWCGQLMHIWVAEKHTFHMLSILREWLVPPVKVLLFFSPFLSHISSCCSPSFFLSFYYKHSPYSRSPWPSLVAAVCKIIITHITIFFFFTRFISGWTMQKIKTVIPKSHEHAHCLKICYWELNPYHFVRRMNRLPSLKPL